MGSQLTQPHKARDGFLQDRGRVPLHRGAEKMLFKQQKGNYSYLFYLSHSVEHKLITFPAALYCSLSSPFTHLDQFQQTGFKLQFQKFLLQHKKKCLKKKAMPFFPLTSFCWCLSMQLGKIPFTALVLKWTQKSQRHISKHEEEKPKQSAWHQT